MQFTKATKEDARLRLALLGPAGSGKTYTALAIACALGRRVAVIDTEHGSASKYADRFGFDRLNLDSFAPTTYVEAIRAAEDAGYDVVVIDSLSHAWMGKGGALEMVDRAAKRGGAGGNSFGAWRDVTPHHNALVEAMISSRCHVVATLRVKTDYEQVKDERTGKTTVRKIGLAPVQRDGLEYEFDVVMDINADHEGVVSKTRCPELTDGIFPKPGADVAKILKAWLSDGEKPRAQEPEATSAPAEFLARVAEIELPGECVAVWIKHRAELAAMPVLARESAWRALCDKCAAVGAMDIKRARVWLKRTIAEEDARRTPPPDGTDGGGSPRREADPVDGDGSAAQSDGADWTRSRDGMRAHLAGKTVVRAVLNSVVAHGSLRGYATLAAERIQALTGWDLDTCERQIGDAFAKANERREREAEAAATVRRAA